MGETQKKKIAELESKVTIKINNYNVTENNFSDEYKKVKFLSPEHEAILSNYKWDPEKSNFYNKNELGENFSEENGNQVLLNDRVNVRSKNHSIEWENEKFNIEDEDKFEDLLDKQFD